MELAVDLHIHSALSPCGDNDMTPNNIVNMALLKGLDIISVTDHNNASNLPALWNVAVKNGIMLLPGIEVQTKEEVHMLCYFKIIANAVKFGNIIYQKLPQIMLDAQTFGEQLILDDCDNVVGNLDKLLLSSADISISNLKKLTEEFNGICIPAHIDRSSFSIISNLGFIPNELRFKTVEISKTADKAYIKTKWPFLSSLNMIRSSDAHYLWDICERENMINIDELTMTNLFNYL